MTILKERKIGVSPINAKGCLDAQGIFFGFELCGKHMHKQWYWWHLYLYNEVIDHKWLDANFRLFFLLVSVMNMFTHFKDFWRRPQSHHCYFLFWVLTILFIKNWYWYNWSMVVLLLWLYLNCRPPFVSRW